MPSTFRKALTAIIALLALSLGVFAAPQLMDWFTSQPSQTDFEGDRDTEPTMVSTLNGLVLTPPRTAPDFELIDQNRNPYRLSDQIGDAVMIFFGYTHCPDVCPASLYYNTLVKEHLGPLADRVQFVFVTVDGERDTPEKLKAYVEGFDPEFIGLWGDEAQTEEIIKNYGVFVEIEEIPNSEHYWVNHSSLTYLIDPAGQLRVAYMFNTDPEIIAEDLRQLIDEYDAQLPATTVEGAWARPGLAGGNSAIYLQLHNSGDVAERLVGAETRIAHSVELHETSFELITDENGQLNQVMRMQEVGVIDVPARSTVELQPGGLHIMLIDLNDDLHEGDTVLLDLYFEGRSPIRLAVPVHLAASGMDMDEHHHH